MKLFFLGDTHGDIWNTRQAIRDAATNDCSEIIQVGDWGFWWPGVRDETPGLNAFLKERDIHMRFIDGNHDWHPRLRQLPEQDGNVASNITYQFRGSVRTYNNGPTVVFFGGAPSIDYRGRVEGKSWWADEQVNDAEVERAEKAATTPDILVTHDAPMLPPGFKDHQSDPTFYYRAVASRLALGRVMDALKPKYLIHGHYHCRYDRDAFCGQPLQPVKIIGLDCNWSLPGRNYKVMEF